MAPLHALAFCTLLSALVLASRRSLDVFDREISSARSRPMLRNLLPENKYEGGKCLFGSPAGYYYRSGSTNTWVMWLRGGGTCSGPTDCKNWGEKSVGSLGIKGSSEGWPEEYETSHKFYTQLDDPVANPLFHDAHHVNVPYCTADGHSGQVGTIDPKNAEWGEYYFDGHLNVKAILSHLNETNPDFAKMKNLLLQGSSAGGSGTLKNCDFVASELRETYGLSASVKCNPIAGWFSPGFTEDNEDEWAAPTRWPEWSSDDPQPAPEPYTIDTHPQKLYVSPACQQAYPDRPHICNSATPLFPTIQTPMLVTQDQFDNLQVGGFSGLPDDEETTCKGQEYISYFGKAMFNSTTALVLTSKGHGLFLSSCWDHGSELTATVQGFNQQEALESWWLNDGKVPSVLTDPCLEQSDVWLPCGQGCQTIQHACGGDHPPPSPPQSPPPSPPPREMDGNCQHAFKTVLCAEREEEACEKCSQDELCSKCVDDYLSGKCNTKTVGKICGKLR